jgi:hypothetical protein
MSSRSREGGGLSACAIWPRPIIQNYLQSVEPADVIRPGERSLESFNDLHPPAAARARGRFVFGGASILDIIIAVTRRRRPGRHIKQTATERKLVSAMTIGKKAIVTNALKPIR